MFDYLLKATFSLQTFKNTQKNGNVMKYSKLISTKITEAILISTIRPTLWQTDNFFSLFERKYSFYEAICNKIGECLWAYL